MRVLPVSYTHLDVYKRQLEQNVEERLQTFFREYTTHTANIGTCKLDSFRIEFRKKKLLVYTNERFAYQPLRPCLLYTSSFMSASPSGVREQ